VPLICTGPKFGIQAGHTISEPVSTVDLAATFLDFAGVLAQAPAGMSTSSLKTVLVGDAPTPLRTEARGTFLPHFDQFGTDLSLATFGQVQAVFILDQRCHVLTNS
jgi:arylsulfatase A-like enzyme